MATWPHRRFAARARSALGSSAGGLRQGLAALLVSSCVDLIGGLTLGAITGTLETLPGLLVLVPAAIGMRGNIFGALGSRLGTAIHTGEFNLTWRRDTVVGQNLLASITLTFALSLALAVLAKSIAEAFGVSTISVVDFAVISVVGGALSSLIVLALTLYIASTSVRRGWDMDNVAAPLITAAGDMVTLPSLFLATYLIGFDVVTPVVASVCVLVAFLALVLTYRSKAPLLRRIVTQSLPILLIAGVLDVIAGLTIEHQLESFLAFPALLVLIPPFLEKAGSLGGILSSRLSSKLHLGLIDPTPRPQRMAREDFALIVFLAVPVFVLVALSAEVASLIFGLASPGALQMVGVSLIGGSIAIALAVPLAYYGGIGAYRLGLDPDTYGIPMLTSTLDLVGAVAFILAVSMLGIA